VDKVALITGAARASATPAPSACSPTAAIISLTKSMGVELAPLGILVNAVAPGWVLTPLSEPFVGTLGDDVLGRISPLRRVGTAAEVAGAVSFLCGPDAGYITGTTVNVDGGLIAMHPAV